MSRTALPAITRLACIPLLALAAAGSAAATTSTIPGLRVEASTIQSLGAGYLQVDGVMSGPVTRGDGSRAAYRVPITFVYPEDSARCNGAAIADVINSVFYETFEGTGTTSDPFFPSLFPAARLFLGDGFFQSHGYVYAHAQWNKLVLERQREAGTLSDPSLQIERGSDGHAILRDLSVFLRRPAEALVGPVPIPCAAANVISFGYSQTGMLLRQFHFAGLNTALAHDPSFDDGLVFEGSVHGGPGGRCRRLTDTSPWFAYTFGGCGGATPDQEGRVMTISTETDLQIVNGWKARAQDGADSSSYRLYEIAATSHIPTPLVPLELVGIRPPAQAEQSFADVFPVYRAMVEHLRRWIDGAGGPPPSVLIQGSVRRAAAPFFSEASWGSDNRLVFVFRAGEDGNGLGGVRLPHVLTPLPGRAVGAPLGLHRGTHCDNDPVEPDFILDCRLSGDESIYNMVGGTFTPYPALDVNLCGRLYPTRRSYTEAVTNAVDYATAQGWILAEEADSILATAEQNALLSPGCVPDAA